MTEKRLEYTEKPETLADGFTGSCRTEEVVSRMMRPPPKDNGPVKHSV